MNPLIFLKLGGSLLTDKTAVKAVRDDALTRLAAEIRSALDARLDLHLLIGHGSGSFGHVAAARYGTRQGVVTAEQWQGFAEVSATAARLNRLVLTALREAGVPAMTFQPSASAMCIRGQLAYLATNPIHAALTAGVVPVIYGDVAIDVELGGTIISTEEIMGYLATALNPSWLLLAGETAGVLDLNGAVISEITPDNLSEIEAALGGSRGTDVTGGMASKVRAMLHLIQAQPHLSVRIFSGLVEGEVQRALMQPASAGGTLLHHA